MIYGSLDTTILTTDTNLSVTLVNASRVVITAHITHWVVLAASITYRVVLPALLLGKITTKNLILILNLTKFCDENK